MAEKIMGWRSVEDAPVGRVVIAWSGGVRLMSRDADTGQWRNMLGRPKATPSHWMPLPEAPR